MTTKALARPDLPALPLAEWAATKTRCTWDRGDLAVAVEPKNDS